MDVVTHAELARLHPTFGHPDAPERIGVLLDRFETAAAGRAATDAELLRCHSAEHLALLRSLDRAVLLEPNTVASATSFEAAALAAGTAIEAVERAGFALVRPPGHHALRDAAYGFCLLNNVAVAARHAQAELGIERVAIVDWDVHHGNGTQAIFAGDDSVFYASLHQYGGGFFPATGGPREQDETTLNVPLPAGSGDTEWLSAFAELVEPRVRAFEPDLVLVSAGFDGHVEEELYLTETRLTDAGYRELARQSAALGPRVAAVLEGGYNTRTLPRLVEAALEGFSSATG